MPEKYPYICPDCGKQYELTMQVQKPRCWKCGALLLAEGQERPGEADSVPNREEGPKPETANRAPDAVRGGTAKQEVVQSVYAGAEKVNDKAADETKRQAEKKKDAGDDCAWANAVKAMGWVAVVVASLYGFIGAGIGGLILGLLASMLAVSGIMMIADMAKDIRRIRMMMEEDQIDR